MTSVFYPPSPSLGPSSTRTTQKAEVSLSVPQPSELGEVLVSRI